MNRKVDYLIVGQGLAGTVLSHRLFSANSSFHVIDSLKQNSASRIAAGIYNPVSYRKLKMAEFASTLIPEVEDYYPKLESFLSTNFFSKESFLKILTSHEELNNWHIQSAIPQNIPFMANEMFLETFENTINNPFGAGQVLQSGVVKTTSLIDSWREFLREQNAISENPFEYNALEILEIGFRYKKVEAENIIFCEGVGVEKNPWFNWLPIQQFKGEVLEIYAPQLQLNRLTNRGVFVLPLGEGYFKIGATHDWQHVDEIPTEEGKQELIDKLEKIISVPYKITKHLAGLRPATRDRHPYIGEHPQHKNMYVFNGLGSKGVIMVPWLSLQFLNALETGEWPKEFHINRFLRFYEDLNHEKN